MTGRSSPADRPLQLAALGCLFAAAAGILWLCAGPVRGEVTQVAVLVSATGLVLAAAWLYVWPSQARLLTDPLLDLPTALQDARSQLTDLQAIRKEYHKVRSDLEGFAAQTATALKALNEAIAQGQASLDARQKAFDQAALDLQKAEREKGDLRQARGDAQRRTEAWQKAAQQFVRVLERTADPEGGLSEAYLKAATKLATDFARTFAPLGMQLLRPAAGDCFDDRIHEIASEIETDTTKPGTVASCAEWGFILGEVVSVKAQVVLAKAPKPVPVPPAPLAAPELRPPDPQEAGPVAAVP